jgi:hypothetical protein
MPRAIRLPSPALVVACLALGVSLSGLGYAATVLPRNSVGTVQLKNGAVKAKKIATNAVKTNKIAPNAVKTDHIADNAVTGTKADEASFEGLIKGDGRQTITGFTVDAVGFLPDPKPVLARVAGMGVVELLYCGGAPEFQIRTRLLSFDDSEPFFGAGTVTSSALPSGLGDPAKSDQTAGLFATGGGSPLIASGGSVGTEGHWDWSLSRGTGDATTGAHVSVNGWNNAGLGGPAQCYVTATVEYQS